MWAADNLPDQTGRLAVITGANSGIGFWATLYLARAGAKVVLACRSEAKAQAAMARIRETVPEAQLSFGALDLADLDSVQRFAETLDEDRIDLLINNAGVMALPRRTTAQGFEMQLGTNHLGHFALTARLIRRLARTPGSRVVSVSSQAHRGGRIDFDDLQSEKRYQRWVAYCQSKLANLLFIHQLAAECQHRRLDVTAVACHPGYASTHLQVQGAEMDGSALKAWVMNTGNALFAQSAEAGAMPTVRAATDPDAKPAAYFGPGGLFELRGKAVEVSSLAKARNPEVARRLWAASEELTLPFPWPA